MSFKLTPIHGNKISKVWHRKLRKSLEVKWLLICLFSFDDMLSIMMKIFWKSVWPRIIVCKPYSWKLHRTWRLIFVFFFYVEIAILVNIFMHNENQKKSRNIHFRSSMFYFSKSKIYIRRLWLFISVISVWKFQHDYGIRLTCLPVIKTSI